MAFISFCTLPYRIRLLWFSLHMLVPHNIYVYAGYSSMCQMQSTSRRLIFLCLHSLLAVPYFFHWSSTLTSNSLSFKKNRLPLSALAHGLYLSSLSLILIYDAVAHLPSASGTLAASESRFQLCYIARRHLSITVIIFFIFCSISAAIKVFSTVQRYHRMQQWWLRLMNCPSQLSIYAPVFAESVFAVPITIQYRKFTKT